MDWRHTIHDSLEKWFPERQIIHRTSGQINSFVIGQKTQIAVVTIAFLIVAWCMITMYNLLIGHNPLRSPAKEVRRVEAEYQRQLKVSQANEAHALALLESQKQEFSRERAEFERRHGLIKDIVSTGYSSSSNGEQASESFATASVMMSPIVRDIVPRSDRYEFISSGDESAGSSLPGVSLTNLTADQDVILLETEASALDTIDRARTIMLETGIDPDILMMDSPFGTGGPEISISASEPEDGQVFGSRIDSIRARVSQADAMQGALSAIPMLHPVADDSYMTSDFGLRRDPFTQRQAFHGGVDIAGRRGAPIVATAPGRVIYAGTKGTYGRVVEIDHDYGIRTRYAHLDKIHVKKGQTVSEGEKIGGMGSTGRSTSTHVHYEVIFQDRTKNPENFMRAGRYVQQD